MSFGEDKSTATTTSSSAPNALALPGITSALSGAARNYASDPYASLDTGEIAGFNPSLAGATASATQIGSQGTPGLASAINGLQGYTNGSMLNPASNPGLQSVISQTLASALPAATGSFTAGNRSDSGLATAAATNAATNAVGNIEYQNYNQEQQNQLEASGLAGSLYGQQLSGANTALNSAGSVQDYLQSVVNAGVAQRDQNVLAPTQNVAGLESAIAGSTIGQYGTQTGSQPYYQNGLLQDISGVSGGLGLAGSLFGGSTGAAPSTIVSNPTGVPMGSGTSLNILGGLGSLMGFL